jgi:hypothetical protein
MKKLLSTLALVASFSANAAIEDEYRGVPDPSGVPVYNVPIDVFWNEGLGETEQLFVKNYYDSLKSLPGKNSALHQRSFLSDFGSYAVAVNMSVTVGGEGDTLSKTESQTCRYSRMVRVEVSGNQNSRRIKQKMYVTDVGFCLNQDGSWNLMQQDEFKKTKQLD